MMPSDFNPPSPWGEGPDDIEVGTAADEFQSTLPVGGGTRRGLCMSTWWTYFNPPSPWGEGPSRAEL